MLNAPRLLALARAASEFKNGEQATTYAADELELLVEEESPETVAQLAWSTKVDSIPVQNQEATHALRMLASQDE